MIYTVGRIGEYGSMSSPASAHTAVAAEPPLIPVARIEHAVEQQFGLSGDYSPLVSERDQNFRLATGEGTHYVVKVTSSAEAAIVSDFHVAALLHLESAGAVRAPRVVRTLGGQATGHIEHGGMSNRLRLVSYLAGEPLSTVPVDPDMARDFGTNLASLDLGLEDFSHVGEHPVLLWDLQRAAELRELLDHIDDPSVRERVSAAIDDFEEFVSPRLDDLRTQVIHGDANPENVLIDPANRRVSGFIDFGDMVRAPLIFDVAIAASYLRTGETDALKLIAPFVAGYHAARPLLDIELALLFDLVRARLATTITLLYWRLGARQDDDPYRRKTLDREASANLFLNALNSLGRASFLQRLEHDL